MREIHLSADLSKPSPPALPTAWWRVGMMWLVLGGPLAVVIAGVTTAVIAVRGADPVLPRDDGTRFSERPAIQGRNHAATADDAR